MWTAAHLLIPHSSPISLNIIFSLLKTTAAFCSDLWYGFRSSTNNRCVIFWLGEWDKVYPSVLPKYHAMGFSARVNCLTQKESPYKIPLFTLIGPIFSLPLLVFTSSVIVHVFMADLMRCMKLLCIPYISSVLIIHWCELRRNIEPLRNDNIQCCCDVLMENFHSLYPEIRNLIFTGGGPIPLLF